MLLISPHVHPDRVCLRLLDTRPGRLLWQSRDAKFLIWISVGFAGDAHPEDSLQPRWAKREDVTSYSILVVWPKYYNENFSSHAKGVTIAESLCEFKVFLVRHGEALHNVAEKSALQLRLQIRYSPSPISIARMIWFRFVPNSSFGESVWCPKARSSYNSFEQRLSGWGCEEGSLGEPWCDLRGFLTSPERFRRKSSRTFKQYFPLPRAKIDESCVTGKSGIRLDQDWQGCLNTGPLGLRRTKMH